MQHLKHTPWRRIRAALTVLALSFIALSSLRTLQQSVVRNPNALASLEVAPAAARAERLRPALPARGYIGYLSDIPDSGTYFRHYYALQYALAPLMFVMVGELPAGIPYTPTDQTAQLAQTNGLLIGNFQSPAALQAAMEQLDLELVAQADPTLVLLRQAHPASTQKAKP